MTKSQLVDQLATKLRQIPRKDLETIVNTVFVAMVDALNAGDRIEIRGFGIFRVKVRDPRVGRNPKTGAKVLVPERRSPYFIVGKELRARLNRPESHVVSIGGGSDGIGSAAAAPVAMAAAPAGRER